ncbi:MAG: nucleoside monophosphate kinase [Thermodesulfovibrionales bacterium]
MRRVLRHTDGRKGAEEKVTVVSMRHDAVLLIGPTGSGKSPLGDHLQEHGLAGRRCHHFDFGFQLRRIAEAAVPPEEFTPREHLFVREVLDKALLLEGEHFPLAQKIVSSFLRQRDCRQGETLILNGLPRHAGQAAAMDGLVSISRLVVLECPAETVHERIGKNTGRDRTGRADDDRHLIEMKLRLFQERTAPLIGHYEGSGCEIIRIRVTGDTSAGEVYEELKRSVRLTER